MNATQPQKLYPNPVTASQLVAVVLPHKQRSHRPKAFEVASMLGVNILLSATAILTLFHLNHYQKNQQAKLQAIQSEVKLASGRVNQAQAQFERNIDPQQLRQIVQEETTEIEPGQMRVVWTRQAAAHSPISLP